MTQSARTLNEGEAQFSGGLEFYGANLEEEPEDGSLEAGSSEMTRVTSTLKGQTAPGSSYA